MQTVTSARTATPVIAFLGTGRMGGPMAANLVRAGFVVRAWDRTASRAAALVKDGATVAASPAQAVKGAGILITMLADGPATEQALRGPDGGLDLAPGLIWIQMATVGMEWTERFVNTATRYRVSFFDAPVSGSQEPAQAGELTILASGPSWMQEAVAPVFAALGRATTWLGPAGNGTRAKLAGDFTPAFALKHALKDAELAAVAAPASGTELTLTQALLPRSRRAAANGHAEDDLAAIYATA
jgi:3-hydroxyisobutyrate dehydrogenase